MRIHVALPRMDRTGDVQCATHRSLEHRSQRRHPDELTGGQLYWVDDVEVADELDLIDVGPYELFVVLSHHGREVRGIEESVHRSLWHVLLTLDVEQLLVRRDFLPKVQGDSA